MVLPPLRLFELIHASFSDGSRQPLDFRTELQISLGICEGMAALAARGLAHGALCSVNVEVLQTGEMQEAVDDASKICFSKMIKIS